MSETQICRVCKIDKLKTDYYKHFRVCKRCTIEKNSKKPKTEVDQYCELCSYKTKSETAFKKHLETKKHIIRKSSGIFTYCCTICNFSAKTLTGLTDHAKTESHIEKFEAIK